MAVRYKVRVERKYKKNGEDKTFYTDIGTIMDGQNGGFVLKIESIPVGWTGWAILSEPEQRSAPQQRAPAPQRNAGYQQKDDGFDDDIPF